MLFRSDLVADLAIRPQPHLKALADMPRFQGAYAYGNGIKAYIEASPINYATVDKNATRFLLIHGTDDDIVDPPTQSIAFLNALNQASFFVRRVIIPGAGHFFVTDPVDETSFGGFAGPRVLRFLQDVKF